MQTLFKCTTCKHWIHKRCSEVRSDLPLVVDGFMCKRCDGTIQEVDLAEDLVGDGETYRCVSFYIWETFLMEMLERILLLQIES